jgi:sugar lactone lactonase YvrE
VDAGNARIRKIGPDGSISTVVGGGADFAKDGLPGSQVQLTGVGELAVDAQNTLYYADAPHNRIRKVNPDGTVSTVIGTGMAGYTGDGGPAAQAKLYQPTGLDIDAAGNFYIVDSGNARIRKVDTNGIITTIGGKGGYPDFLGGNGDGGPATEASFFLPVDIAADALGNVYVSDSLDQTVRKISPEGIISTFAGQGLAALVLGGGALGDGGPAGKASLSTPGGLDIDSQGHLLIADSRHHRIRTIEDQGVISTLAGGGGLTENGSATLAALVSPSSVAVDATGNVFIADGEDYRIRRVSSEGAISTFMGDGVAGDSGDGGPASEARFGSIAGIAFDDAGNFYLADIANNRIRRVTPDGMIRTIGGSGFGGFTGSFFSGDGGPAARAQIFVPQGLSLDTLGNLYFADSGNQRIRKIDAQGIITTVAGNGVTKNLIEGDFSGDGGPALKAALNIPSSVVSDRRGNLYIADSGNHRIRKVSPDGTISTYAGNGVTDSFEVSDFSGDGGPAVNAQLNFPTSVAMDSAGTLFIADELNNRIRKVSPDGTIITVAGNGEAGFSGDTGPATDAALNDPLSITLDRRGNLYIAEAGSHRVREVFGVAAPALIVGDLNHDGTVNIQDVVLSLQLSVNLRTPSEDDPAVGDINLDGRLDIQDTVLLLQKVVGIKA